MLKIFFQNVNQMNLDVVREHVLMKGGNVMVILIAEIALMKLIVVSVDLLHLE